MRRAVLSALYGGGATWFCSLDDPQMKELRSILARLHAPDAFPAAMATLARVRGSSYRRPGARLLLTADGARTGAISGGCLEDDVLLRAKAVVAGGEAQVVTYDTTEENDLVWGVGLGCHGVVDVVIERLAAEPGWSECVRAAFARRADAALALGFTGKTLGTRAALAGDGKFFWGELALRAGLEAALAARASHHAEAGGAKVFFEYVPRPTPLVIFGAGDDAQPLCRMAAELGFAVSVLDARAALATRERFPEADAVLTDVPEKLAGRVPLDERTMAVVMTHHYVHDVPLLRALLPSPLAYLGLLGPRQRAEKILGDLAAAGLEITREMRARLRAPVGLDIGATTPESVALAVLAEIQAVLAGRDGRPLRERGGPIHES
jgi:xanthine/CO dehydrogenase XdhC/CoxF family maturation factor